MELEILDGVFSPEGVRVPTSAERARALFSWQGGAYGEVLLAAPGSEPPPRPKSARDELALSCFSHVLLSLCEAFHLAFHCGKLGWPLPAKAPASLQRFRMSSTFDPARRRYAAPGTLTPGTNTAVGEVGCGSCGCNSRGCNGNNG